MILVDSNIWIFSAIKEYPEHELAKSKIESIEKESIVINTIILSEVFHKLSILLGLNEAIRKVDLIMSSEFVIYLPIEETTVKRSIDLTKNNIRTNDAVIAQHAKDIKCRILTDNIKDFQKINGLEIMKFR